MSKQKNIKEPQGNAGLPRVSNPVCPKCKSTNNTGLTYDDKYCCLDCSNIWAND